MLELAVVLVHATHLVCMNVASAGPLVCIWLDWKERGGDREAGEAGRSLALASLVALVAGSVLGVALGALLWNDAYVAILRRLSSKIHFGVWELLFSLVLLAGYLVWWKLRPQAGTTTRVLRSLLAVLLTTNLLYHFPVLFGVISHLGNQNAVEGGSISPADFRQLLVTGYVASRSVHFILASVAVSGVALIAYSLWRSRRDDRPAWPRLARAGGWIALVPSLAQIPVGMWVLVALPSGAKRQLMGQDLLGSILLMVAVLAALWLMHLMSSVAIGKASRGRCRLVVVATLVVVLLMTALAHRARPPRDPTAAGNRLGQPTPPSQLN